MTKATKQFDSDEEHDFNEELPQDPAKHKKHHLRNVSQRGVREQRSSWH